MIGRASVLAVFCASIYFDIWGKMSPDTDFLLAIAFVLAFISADEPWVKYIKTVTVEREQPK